VTVEEVAQGPVSKPSLLWDDTNMKNQTTQNMNSHQKALSIIEKKLNEFVDRLEFLTYFIDSPNPTISEILVEAEMDQEASQEFVEIAGCLPQLVRRFLDEKLLNESMVNLALTQARA
jgi:hypothetical protein